MAEHSSLLFAFLEEWKEAKIDYSHKIGFELQSSDNGMFGMNTPAYFSLSLIQRLPVSISEVKKEVEVMAYPNPTSDLLHFVSQNSIENISILSLQGEKVQNYIVDNKSAVLNIENLPSGIYLARVYTEEGIATKRFIKQ